MRTHDTPELAAHFWTCVDVRGPDDCWPYRKYLDRDGYGWFSAKGRAGRAHRMAYEVVYGSPGKLCVCHACDNRACCNPAHLWLGTNQENTADRHRKGRSARGAAFGDRCHPKGEAHWRAVFTEEQVVEMRRLYAAGVGGREIARRFGRSLNTVNKVIYRATWRHVP